MGVEPKIGVGKPPQIIPLKNRVWNPYFHHPFWGKTPPIFGSTPTSLHNINVKERADIRGHLEPDNVIPFPIENIECNNAIPHYTCDREARGRNCRFAARVSLKRQCFEYRKQHQIACTIHIDNTIQENISRYVCLALGLS